MTYDTAEADHDKMAVLETPLEAIVFFILLVSSHVECE